MNTGTYPLADFAEALDDILSGGGTFKLYPKGSSMLPLIRSERDAVILIAPDTLAENDIILFRRENGAFVLHRLIEIRTDGGYVVCGDGQTWTETVRREQIVAKVAEIHRGGCTVTADQLRYRIYVFLWRLHYPRRFYALFRRLFRKKPYKNAKE